MNCECMSPVTQTFMNCEVVGVEISTIVVRIPLTYLQCHLSQPQSVDSDDNK
jgi:hypothetical protein